MKLKSEKIIGRENYAKTIDKAPFPYAALARDY